MDDENKNALGALLSKSWDDYEILEHAGNLFFPAELKRIQKTGEFEIIKVLLRVPREPDNRKFRIEARKIALEDGLDLKEDADLVDNLEIICTMAWAIRNTTAPYEPWEPDPKALEKRYDRGSIMQLWGQLDALATAIDPAAKELDDAQMSAVLAAIAKERSIRPLAVLGPDAQSGFIVTMADRLLSYMAQKSSSDASEPSTPGSSALSN
jgi:hypothetical protein